MSHGQVCGNQEWLTMMLESQERGNDPLGYLWSLYINCQPALWTKAWCHRERMCSPMNTICGAESDISVLVQWVRDHQVCTGG